MESYEVDYCCFSVIVFVFNFVIVLCYSRAMNLIHKLMHLFLPPLILLTSSFTLSLVILFNFIYSFLRPALPIENMTGKVALITGASSGIGEHIAYEYAKKGASLVLVARRENSLREVARKAVQLGSPDVLAVPADVSKVHECKKFVEEAVNHFGRLDHLVCNAGIISFCAFEDITGIGNFTPLMDINFWGSIYTTSFAIPHLKKTKGKIIANASSSGWLISPTLSLYGASKAAVINFYERLRKELEPDVKVTIAALGFIESEMSQGKHLDNEGVVKVNQEMRDVSIGILPILSVGKCAESIVNKACRGERYVIEPPWFKVLILIQFLCPTLLEWAVHFLYVTKSGTPVTNARNKKILDAIGGKKFLYPSSILSSQIKKD